MNRPMTLKIFGGEEELGEGEILPLIRSLNPPLSVGRAPSISDFSLLIGYYSTDKHTCSYLPPCTLDADDTVDAPPTPFLYLSPPTHPYSIVCTERKKKAACERNR